MAKAAKPAAKKAAGKKEKAMTKSQFVAHLADKVGITKKQVDGVLDEIINTVKAQVSGKGPGKFVFPNLCRVTVKHKEAQPGGEKKINPLNKQEYTTKPKPAHNVVKLHPVKSLKDALK